MSLACFLGLLLFFIITTSSPAPADDLQAFPVRVVVHDNLSLAVTNRQRQDADFRLTGTAGTLVSITLAKGSAIRDNPGNNPVVLNNTGMETFRVSSTQSYAAILPDSHRRPTVSIAYN